MKFNIQAMVGIAAISFAGAASVSASTVNYSFGQVSGGDAPAGSPPWVQASFTDVGMPANSVQLTLSAVNLSGGDFVSSWYFNVDPTLNPSSLTFSVASSTGLFTDPTIQTGANSFKAGPDGKFDILLGFATGGTAATQFGSGDTLTYIISGISGLTADDFNSLSTTAGGKGAYYSAANIHSSGDCPSWINPTTTTFIQGNARTDNVPDGSATITLLGAALAGIGVFRRKMQSRSAR